MASIEFQICGDRSPFLAAIYESGTTTPIYRRDVQGNDGCVVFSGLEQYTPYEVKVIDSIGRIVTSGFTTQNSLPMCNPPRSYVYLCGVLKNTSTSQTISTPKQLVFNYPLKNGQFVSVCLSAMTCNVLNTTSCVTIYCNGLRQTPISCVGTTSQFMLSGITRNDIVCYDLYTRYCTGYSSGNVCGCAGIKLTCAYDTYCCVGYNGTVTPVISTQNTLSTKLNVTSCCC
jgi:hypothetical protein